VIETPQVVTRIVHETCGSCGIHFGLEESHRKALLRSGDRFYCPNGHYVHYCETTEQRLRRELEEKSRRCSELACEVTKERAIKYQERTQKKRFATMLHNHRVRARHGVCPCCQRTFRQLARHMENKHPGYANGKELS
jgi:hypothetical protein